MIPRQVILKCFFLTVLVFVLAFLLNHAMDFLRISVVAEAIQDHEISTQAFAVEQAFMNELGESKCGLLSNRIGELMTELRKVGGKLGAYSRFSPLRKQDFDYLKRKYFLLELRLYTMVQSLNKECAKPYVPILFFYEIDHDESERQGFILEEISKAYEDEVFVVSFDKDYQDEPLVQLLAEHYEVEEAPIVVIDGQRFQGLTYVGPLNQSIQKILTRPDPYGESKDFHYVTRAAGVNETRLIKLLKDSPDSKLITGRLTNNPSKICEAAQEYSRMEAKNEERAFIHETLASLGCGRSQQYHLYEAAKQWRSLGVEWRAKLLERLIENPLYEPPVQPAEIRPKEQPLNWSTMTIGNTTIKFNTTQLLLHQVDRVDRDWISGQMGDGILTVFSERLTWPEEELHAEIGWHEGGRLKDMMPTEHASAKYTLVTEHEGKWYAPDEQGMFRFEVPLDKVLYPTTRFLREDIAVITDTHGINMMVEQAIRMNATAVMGCCDHPGKVAAAAYLGRKNISSICLTDKYVHLAIGHGLPIAGSPPIRRKNSTIVVGGRPLHFGRNETIVVSNSTNQPYALWYYQAPSSYFNALRANSTAVLLEDFGQMDNLTRKARAINATTIAVRVYNKQDYEAVSDWLQEPEHKAILFHSVSYPYGKMILEQYPNQTTFNDPNIIYK